MRPIVYLAAGLALPGCQPLPSPEPATLTPHIPPGEFAPDPTDQAIILAQDVFSYGRGLTGDPARAARAAATIEFLATDFTTMRWMTAPGMAAQQLQLARRQLRDFLNVPADAAAQAIITPLLEAAAALEAGDRARAEAVLTGGPFRDPPPVTLSRLNALPRLTQVAAGADAAWVARFRPREDGGCVFPC